METIRLADIKSIFITKKSKALESIKQYRFIFLRMKQKPFYTIYIQIDTNF
jgi:hypothetical protein